MRHRQFSIFLLILATTALLAGTLLPIDLPLINSHAWGGSPGNETAAVEEPVEFYQYTDREGVIHFADTIENIPNRYRNRLIVRRQSIEARKTTAVKIENKQILIPASFKNGARRETASMVIDTGASITCITEDLATRLGIDMGKVRFVSMAMADGSMVEIRVTKVGSLTVGDRMRSPFEIGILPKQVAGKEYDGYLGLDFLGGFPHRIDFRNGLIHWD